MMTGLVGETTLHLGFTLNTRFPGYFCPRSVTAQSHERYSLNGWEAEWKSRRNWQHSSRSTFLGLDNKRHTCGKEQVENLKAENLKINTCYGKRERQRDIPSEKE